MQTSLKVNAVIASGTLTYAWSSGSTLATQSLTPTATAVYTVTVANGTCTASATTAIKVAHCCLSGATGDVIVYNTAAALVSNVGTLTTALAGNSNFNVNGATTVTYKGSTPVKTIFINGVFKVNSNLIFEKCNIQFGEQAEVYINPGRTLKFSGCDISSCNGYTWRSIFADDASANLIVEDYTTGGTTHCTLYDADTTINFANDAQYNITNSRFNNNYVSIALYNYMAGVKQTNTTGNISGNTFTSNALKLPWSASGIYFSNSAISLNYTEDLIIGKASNTASIANTFQYAVYGIYAYNANFSAYHNYFENMQYLDAATPGACIVTNSKWDANDRTIVIGNGASTGLNKFNNSGNGIVIYGQQNIDINNNDFGLTTKLTGITTSIGQNKAKLISIRNNHFKDYFIGTAMSKIYSNATVSIDNNTYTDAFLGNQSDYYYGTAITVSNKILGSSREDQPFTISNNTIINPRLGIHVANMDQVNIGTDNNPNTITYPFTSAAGISDYYVGVWMQHCSNMRVVGNTIENPGAVISGTTLFRGIDNETSTDGRINCNTITNIPYSMNFYGNCDGTLLRNNVMSEYDEAIHLDKATLPDQYQWNDATSDAEPMHNVWNDAAANDRVTGIKATINPINWYYETGQTDQNPDPTGLSSLVFPQDDAAGIVACDDFSNRQSREERFGAVVGDTMHFEEDQNENTYFAKSIALKAMDDNAQLLSQGNANDADYVDFYNAMKQSNIGMFDSINNITTDTNLISNAIAINASITDTNTIEYYKKTVLDIYLNTAAQNIPLSENDTAVCDFISSLSYFTAGDAIYIAAGLIGKEIHPSNATGLRTVKQVIKNDNANPLYLFVFPNPANDKIFVTGLNGENGYVEIFDEQGKKIMIKSCYGENITIDVSKLSNGVYRLNIKSASGIYKAAKFSVLK